MKFKIVIEDTRSVIRAKEFEASTMEEAREMAEAEEWTNEGGWEDIDQNSNSEIRDELCS